jgi:hypothetical protein
MPIMDSAMPLPADEPAPLRDLADAWDHILTELRTRIRREQFDTWFRRAVPIALDAVNCVWPCTTPSRATG